MQRTPESTRKTYEEELITITAAARQLVARLGKLEQSQKDAVVGLLALSSWSSGLADMPIRADAGVLTGFGEAVSTLSPHLGAALGHTSVVAGCFDEHVAYASAMAKCKADGKSDDECEKEHAGLMAATVICAMKKIEEGKRKLSEVLEIDLPPTDLPPSDLPPIDPPRR